MSKLSFFVKTQQHTWKIEDTDINVGNLELTCDLRGGLFISTFAVLSNGKKPLVLDIYVPKADINNKSPFIPKAYVAKYILDNYR